MDPLEDYANRLNRLPIDLRAEVVLADMLEDGIWPDELILNPEGSFNRATGRDISGTTWVESARTSKRWLQLNLNRSGLYDLLPEGVFHQPTTNEVLRDKEALLREMEIQRTREQAARQFFLPLEQEFLHQRVRIEQEERQLLQTGGSDDLLAEFWDFPAFLVPAQTNRLVYLLPLMHQLAGNLAATKACFEQVIDDRVSLSLDAPGASLHETDTAPLGQWQLGETSVLDGWLTDEEPTLQLTIHIDQPERLAEYLPGNTGRRAVEWLSEYLVPLDVSLRIDLDTSALEEAFWLTDEPTGCLNFTTNLDRIF